MTLIVHGLLGTLMLTGGLAGAASTTLAAYPDPFAATSRLKGT